MHSLKWCWEKSLDIQEVPRLGMVPMVTILLLPRTALKVDKDEFFLNRKSRLEMIQPWDVKWRLGLNYMKGHTNVQIVLFTTPIPKAMFWRKDFHSSQNLAPNIHHAKGLSQRLASLTFARFTCRQCSMQRSWLSKAFFNFDCFNVHIRLFHSTGWKVVSSFLFSKAGEEKELKGWWT